MATITLYAPRTPLYSSPLGDPNTLLRRLQDCGFLDEDLKNRLQSIIDERNPVPSTLARVLFEIINAELTDCEIESPKKAELEEFASSIKNLLRENVPSEEVNKYFCELYLESIKLLINELKTSGILSEEILENLNQWISECYIPYFSFTGEIESKERANALFLLLNDIILKSVGEEDPTLQKIWFSVVKGLLKELIPRDVSVHTFIQNRNQLDAEFSDYLAQIEEIEITCNSLLERLSHMIDNITEDMLTAFEELQNNLLRLHDTDSEVLTATRERLDVLSSKMSEIAEKFKARDVAFEDLDKKIERLRSTISARHEEAKTALGKL